MKELIQKWRDEAESCKHTAQRMLATDREVYITECNTLLQCADELEAALAPESSDSIFHETVLHNQKEIKSALDFHKTVLVYFNDSPIPARVINVTNREKAAVYVQHGKQFFWVRIGKSSVSRIVLHEMRLESV